MTPQAALDKLLSEDPGRAQRQVGIIDAQGRIAAHTGERCVAAAGHTIGTNCCAQANVMARDTVWRAMVSSFADAGVIPVPRAMLEPLVAGL